MSNRLFASLAAILCASCLVRLAGPSGPGDDGGGDTPDTADTGCQPTVTCASLGAGCGDITDDCGQTVNCGTCSSGSCDPTTNQCVGCTPDPTPCATQSRSCGPANDGCGTTVDCGACATGATCDASGTCVSCTPLTAADCASHGWNCGTPSDGCGGTISCGTCSNPGDVCATTTHQCGPPGTSDPIIAAAGDICGSCDGTAALLDTIFPAGTPLAAGWVVPLGDNAYDSGTITEYTSNFDPTWGRHKDRMHPCPGNHESNDSPAFAGYFNYFSTGLPAPGVAPPGGWYSWDPAPGWHAISLNADAGASMAGGAQYVFADMDLTMSSALCQVVYWHEPVFTRGSHSNDEAGMHDLFAMLQTHGVDIVLNGHDHNYQRYGLQTADGVADPVNGIREWVVGTGGGGNYTFSRTMPNVEASDDSSFGVLKLTLHPTSYDFEYIAVPGSSFTDTGSQACH